MKQRIKEHSLTDPITHSVTHWTKELISHSVNKSPSKSINQLFKQKINEPIRQASNESINYSYNRSVSQSINRSTQLHRQIKPSTSTSGTQSVNHSRLIGSYTQSSFLILLISNSARCSWIPGSEPIHLDLEKLFLLSDSMENLKSCGNVEISEPDKRYKKTS